ncbi:MAG: NAD(P)(+) transhydrogenase (Re/Si-specific) subunit beta, partial [Roseovarius confluentis]
MSTGLVSATYIAASVLFILALGGLKNQESAKRAIWYGIVGMGLAMVATIFSPGVGNLWLIILTVAAGAVAGVFVAQRVQMTEMPQLVAALHSFVGLAAVFIGLNADIMLSTVSALRDGGTALADADLTAFGEKLWKKDAVEVAILKVEVFLGIFIGAVTFTGSVVAFGKLAGKIDGKPKKLILPNAEAPIPFISGHWLNALSVIACLILGIAYFNGADIWTMVLVTLIAGFIGWHLIMGIGGADMPVVVSMLNSYSGWAAAAIGFTL